MRKKRLLTYIIMILSLVAAAKMFKDVYHLWRAEDRLSGARRTQSGAKEEKRQLERELEQAESDEWWERQVRDKLMMARSEETVVIVPEEITSLVDPGIKDEIRQGQEDEQMRPWQKWWDLFMVK